MSETTNQMDALYPMKYSITRHNVNIYDKNLNVIGEAKVGQQLYAFRHMVTTTGESMQVLMGSADEHVFLIKDSEFVGSDDAEVVAGDIDTNTDLLVEWRAVELNARVSEMTDIFYGPDKDLYKTCGKLQKGQKVIIKGYINSIYDDVAEYGAVYQKAKKTNDVKYLGFVNMKYLTSDEKPEVDTTADVAPVPVQDKVEQVATMEEGPKKEELKAEIRKDLVSDAVVVMCLHVDTKIKRENVYAKLEKTDLDGCEVVELGDGKSFAEMLAAGFKDMPTDYTNYTYVIVPVDRKIAVKKQLLGKGLKPIIVERG